MGSSRLWILETPLDPQKQQPAFPPAPVSGCPPPTMSFRDQWNCCSISIRWPRSARGESSCKVKWVQRQPLSTAVFFVNIMLLEWWLTPTAEEKDQLADSLCQCLDLLIYLQKRCYPDSSVSVHFHTHRTLHSWSYSGDAWAKPQEPRREIGVLLCGYQPGCSLATDMDVWWLVS